MSQRLRIVITGVTSFIGIHLVKYFVGLGYEVTSTMSRPQNQYSDERLDRINLALRMGAQIEVLDITCQEEVTGFINRLKPSYWIHHAGWAHNYQSLDYDLTHAHSVNVAPLGYIYPALKNAGCLGVILTGSSAEYSDRSGAALESHMCAPTMPYGLAKLSQTLRAKQLAEQYLLPTRVARVFIPFGPMDAPGKLVPSVVAALRANVKISLTVCSQIRDFLFIDELVSGYGCLLGDLQRHSHFEIFNLSSGEPVRLKDFLSEIAGLLKADTKLLKFGDRLLREGDVGSSWGDNLKAQSILGWKPDSLKIGIARYLNGN
jgi:nucleoside-diphosphate-sugar epimerase